MGCALAGVYTFRVTPRVRNLVFWLNECSIYCEVTGVPFATIRDILTAPALNSREDEMNEDSREKARGVFLCKSHVFYRSETKTGLGATVNVLEW